jgi:excisionase family DNA binding protein
MPNYLTTKEIADQLGWDHSQVRRAIANGWLKSQKKGHTNLITQAEFIRWKKAGATVYPKKS